MVGSLIGSLIDPPKIQGPRIGDLKLIALDVRRDDPVRLGHRSHRHQRHRPNRPRGAQQSSGGKGGADGTSFTYSVSWLAALAMRLPNRSSAIVGITALYLDGRLYWSTEGGGECPCRVYTGTEDQEPDPTFEAIHGVGLQPAYRGIAYLAFTDFDLSAFGNRLPNVEAIVVTSAGTSRAVFRRSTRGR
jgi:hypothetical protein